MHTRIKDKSEMCKAVFQNENREYTHFRRRYFVGFGGFPLFAMWMEKMEKPLLDYKYALLDVCRLFWGMNMCTRNVPQIGV